MTNETAHHKILAVDIGGSNVKACILNAEGGMENDYQKVPTPQPASPENVIGAIQELTKRFPQYDKVSVGFPGYVRGGIVYTAPNLGTELWAGVNLSSQLTTALGKPTRVVNDADMQGLGVVSGQGLEMMITLGTGFGTALLLDGHLLPHLEFSHAPIKKNVDYDMYIGEAAFDKEGSEKWNERMKKVFQILKTVFNYDRLYISGGNAKKLSFPLDDNMKVVSNKDGIKGGARLWQFENDSVVR
ncbi:MAG TPA: ROK family protein [Chitinophagaceae bacterium]|nr:ROK family protein [Chitinophagaceae bacterium]